MIRKEEIEVESKEWGRREERVIVTGENPIK